MSDELKKQLQPQEPEDLGELNESNHMGEVAFMPCGLCGSDNYDLFEGDVSENGFLEPVHCDQCGMGNVTGPNSKITIH